MRLKQRFIVCYVEKIGSSKDVTLTENVIAKAIKEQLENDFGIAYASKDNGMLSMTHYDNQSGYCILVCSRMNVDRVRASLSFINEIGIAKVRFSLIATKSMEKRALVVLEKLKEMKQKGSS